MLVDQMLMALFLGIGNLCVPSPLVLDYAWAGIG
jgi:branched-subunit amino acid permease